MKNLVVLQARQGDVLVRKIDSLPKDAKKRKSNVIALGEATGHSHTVHGATMYQVAENLVFVVAEEAEIKHQEHATIMLPLGTYEVVHQREYTPEAIRRVDD